MISLHSVTKSIEVKGEASKLVFYPTSVDMPADRRVVILGGRHQGKTVLLNLLSGALAPDSGELVVPVKLSPIANSRRLFHALFSAEENIRLYARMSGVDGDALVTGTANLCGLGAMFGKPIQKFNGQQYQELEIAMLSLLPFDCYLLDDASRVQPELLHHYLGAAERRRAGVIFTTVIPRIASQYADYAIVVHGGTAQAFDHVQEAIESYERKAV